MYIKFLDSKTPIECSVKRIASNIVELIFADKIIVNQSGFRAYKDENCEYDIGGNYYEGFTTMYRNDETIVDKNGYQLSNDGSVYETPYLKVTFNTSSGGSLDGTLTQEVYKYEELKIPTPIADTDYEFIGWSPEIPSKGTIGGNKTFTATFKYVPTLEDVKNSKLEEIKNSYNNAMLYGNSVTLLDGTVLGISITQDFINTTNTAYLSAITLYGSENVLIPFEIENVCYSLSPLDVILIYIAEQKATVYNKSLKNELITTIERKETKEDVETISYNVSYLDDESLIAFETSILNGENTIKEIMDKYGIVM